MNTHNARHTVKFNLSYSIVNESNLNKLINSSIKSLEIKGTEINVKDNLSLMRDLLALSDEKWITTYCRRTPGLS